MLSVFGDQTFVAISWACKKQTAASHSSSESEVTSLDWFQNGRIACVNAVIDVFEPLASRARSDPPAPTEIPHFPHDTGNH